MSSINHMRYSTAGGVVISYQRQSCDGKAEMARRLPLLDAHRGALLSCGVEYPGRYRHHQLLLLNPPLQLVARGRELVIEALNARGELLLLECKRALGNNSKEYTVSKPVSDTSNNRQLCYRFADTGEEFCEENRTRQPSSFSILRELINHFAANECDLPGLYGAFGYDLAFQFEAVNQRLQRAPEQRDMVLYFPDEILTVDPVSGAGDIHRFEFLCRDEVGDIHTTGGLKRQGISEPSQQPCADGEQGAAVCVLPERPVSDHHQGDYEAVVESALAHFQRGDLFEVVPGQTFSRNCRESPVTLFERLVCANPSPYAALLNLGQGEYLVAASPEMFVRVKPDADNGDLVETCPISGTIARGDDALEDAERIRQLLNSSKDEAELSMCTDVDRNDKSRVCVPGSVQIVGRRQVELYSRLIHTVDHVQGRLLARFDALDAFLSHTWAVTVTGAPKQRAMQFIEDHERSPRRWYGGAFGRIGFDGSMDTGLTIRTIHIEKGVAQVRAGATLLQDSDPLAEEQETRLKASALLAVLQPSQGRPEKQLPVSPGAHLNALMVDHQDSFVHTLGAAFRSCGVTVETLRPDAARQALRKRSYDLVILSPGPGRPADFDCQATLALCEQSGMPVFGVCLGLQAMIEYEGGRLSQLPRAVHGRGSRILHQGTDMFRGLDKSFIAGRYHSIAAAESVPESLKVTARSCDDNYVMAIEHKRLPWTAVQFHPESLLSQQGQAGNMLIRNVVRLCHRSRAATAQRVGGQHG